MANFCPNCGKPVNADDIFCEVCGTRLKSVSNSMDGTRPVDKGKTVSVSDSQNQKQIHIDQTDYSVINDTHRGSSAVREQTYAKIQYAGNGKVRTGIPEPGYSDRVNDPEILRAIKKSGGASKILGLLMVPLPLMVVPVVASITGGFDMEDALKIGLILSVIMLFLGIRQWFGSKTSRAYEAVVTDKKILNQSSRMSGSQRKRLGIEDDPNRKPEYVILVQTTDGKIKKLTENPIEADRCSKCGLPLLK